MNVGRVLISGAGIGGLALATALARWGVEVDVVEIKADNAVQGIGISVPANAIRAQKRLGIVDAVLDVGLVFDSYRLFDAAGDLVAIAPMPQKREDGLPSYLGIARPAYAQILLDAAVTAGAKVHFSASISEIEEKQDSVGLLFADGVRKEYDLVVGADGVRSTLRRRLFGTGSEPLYTGAVCWRVPAPRPPEVTYMATFQGVGSRAGLVPISRNRMYYFLVDGHEASQPENVQFDPTRYYDILHSRLGEYGGIIGELRSTLAGSASQIVYSPFERVVLPQPWHRGRIVLIGDAAHAMSANISQGATSALEDAFVLAEELLEKDHVEEALAAYGARRADRVRYVQDLSYKMLLNEVSTDPADLASRPEDMKAVPERLKGVEEFLAKAP